MEATQLNPMETNKISLQQSVVEVINSKIQKVDTELKMFLANLHNPDQTPGRASDMDGACIEKQKHIFNVIESSCKQKTKFFYLKVRVTEFNSAKILHLISSCQIAKMSLQELKEEVR
jgi:hypothetical protein